MDLPPTTKPKSLSTVPLLPKGWDRCHAYLDRKSRFCRQEILPSLASVGLFYCGNHRHLYATSEVVTNLHLEPNLTTTIDTAGSRKRKRIPCPVDPSHHIYDDMVEKHVEKCPKTIELRSQQQQNFYCYNCNCGGHGRLTGNKDQIRSNNTKMEPNNRDDELEWAKHVAISVLVTYRHLFPIESKMDVDVNYITTNDIMNSIRLHDLSQQEFDAGFTSAVSDYRIKSGGIRHMHQQASLIGHLRRISVLDALDSTLMKSKHAINEDTQSKDNVDISKSVVGKADYEPKSTRIILEMGAGRGMTGLVVAGVSAMNNHIRTHFTMIERSASRSRAEKFLRKVKQFESSFTSNSNYLTLSSIDWNRIQCDLSHVDVKTVLCPKLTLDHNDDQQTPIVQSQNESVVVVAKHLCGVGTDLALKSLENIKGRITACIMSTCCHGICSWKDYVGRDYLLDAILHDTTSISSFGEKEFDLLRLWSSGTVRDSNIEGTTTDNYLWDDNDHNEIADVKTLQPNDSLQDGSINITNVTKIVEALNLQCGAQGLGRACQRLIDYGRCEYLRHHIFNDRATTTKSNKVNVNLIYYVPDSVTPQNAALIGYIDDR
jgi:tRNA:m4X modification enzyme